MNQPVSAREEILSRIRTAVPATPEDAGAYAQIPRLYQRSGQLSAEARLHLLLDRLIDYDAEVTQLPEESGIPEAIAAALTRDGESRVVVPAEFPCAWLPTDGTFTITLDNALSTAALDTMQTVITTCELAVASTGTIILVHSGAQGRRALTLLPDHHICLLRRDQIVETIPAALGTIAASAKQPITTISGPSATSDIEMTRVRGVHGPRRLTVILYGR